MANPKTQAFTLIELLVVVATIALLVSMLLPAVAGTKLKTTSTQCLANLRQLQMAWTMYCDDNKDYIAGNHWMDQITMTPNVGNWVSGRIDPIQPDRSENTNKNLLLNPTYGALGPYAKTASVYTCTASKVLVKEGSNVYPLVRTVSMNCWMGFSIKPRDTGYRNFRKRSDITPLSPSSALVFVEERDNSVDDGVFQMGMVENMVINVPTANHGGSGGLTFADGHAEMHRWQTSELQGPPQVTATNVSQFLIVTPTHADLLWLRAHSTVK